MAVQKNIIVLDTETSGLSHSLGQEVVQIYAHALNGTNFDDHSAGHFHAVIKPQRPDKAAPGALKVIGPLWDEAMKNGLDPKVVWPNFNKWVNTVNPSGKGWTKPIFIAYNALFDYDFIKEHMIEYKAIIKNKEGLYEFPWGPVIDAMGLAHFLFENANDIDNLKLDTILAKLGIARETQHHSAEEDVKLLVQFVRRAYMFSRKCQKQMRVNPPAEPINAN